MTRSRAFALQWIWIFWLCVAGSSAALAAADHEPRLMRSLFRLEPSEARLQTLPVFSARWWIPADMVDSFGRELRRQHFSTGLIEELVNRLDIVGESGDGVITPDAALLDRFSEAERGAWFDLLARDRRNETHRWPMVLTGASLGELEKREDMRDAASRVRRWSVQRDGLFLFGDFFVLEDAFPSPVARRAFFQDALGADTLLLKLEPGLENPGDVQARAGYWLARGRYRAIEPFLNAVSAIEEHDRIDVGHLLPQLPRALLYTYPPDLSRAEDPNVESGMLATEFFATMDGLETNAPGGLAAWLERECDLVTGRPAYGDIVAFEDRAETPWPYAAVYVADGIVFGRHPTAFGPWVFMPRDDIARRNPRLGSIEPRVYRPREPAGNDSAPLFARGRIPKPWWENLTLRPAEPGPWGRLWFHEVLLAPPASTLEMLPPPDAQEVWTFTGVSREEISGVIDRIHAADTVKEELRALFRNAAPAADGSITVHPSLQLVLDTPRDFRARIFPHLVGGDAATDAVQHIPFPSGTDLGAWFDTGSMPAAVREIIQQLTYPAPDGGFLLSDYGALYHTLETPGERLAAQRAALRAPALIVLLEKPRAEDVPEIARYWSLDPGKNVGRLLESFAGDESARFLDVIHLLPPIAREFINTYFVSDTPVLTPSCFWTTFNFGSEQPDQRYLVIPGQWTEHRELAWMELMTRHDMIDAPSQLGDIIVYRKAGAPAAEHVCSYVADDIVYTKNGFTFSAPWHLSRLAEVDALYLKTPDMERVYFRRR